MTLSNVSKLLPDETVYSYLARLHGLWGESNYRHTAFRWLGKNSASIDQRLPLGLSQLANTTGIDVCQLLYSHTFFPIFAAYSAAPDELRKSILSGYGAAISNLSNVSQSGLARLNDSYYCPECLEEDIRVYGVAYWHLEHQFAGVNACVRHGTVLLAADTISSRLFALPPQTRDIPREQASFVKVRFAAEILLHNNFFKPFATDTDEIFWLDADALLHHKKCLKGRNTDMRTLMAKVEELSIELFDDKSVMSEVVARSLLNEPNYYCHPLKAILLNYALEALPIRASKPRLRTTNNSSIDSIKSRCQRLLIEHRYSLREIARRINRSVGYVKSIAGKLGVAYQRRTQFITPDVEARIKHRAIAGHDRASIAVDEAISEGAVEQIIQSVRGLSIYRQYLRMLRKQAYCRDVISRGMELHPRASRSDLKRRFSAEYTWLYKYDKKWLYQTIPESVTFSKRRG
ncbi:TnsD family Tn7-like transposition protein [Idiomarina abyssalis]|uniref:TnsD family Tn7-like transposition protein n=1 Tax=Idiomarina abyssalis TaxID=86102 RepID=UPI003A920F13